MDESEVAENLLPPPPERVGPYRLEDRLGIGGMGAVYRAYDERLERPVAIKHILPELAGDARAWKRLRHEAKTVARMNHPAVVQIYDIEETDQGDWIVMELVDGETLFSKLKGGPLELDVALDLIRQVTAGLAAAHAKGVVHRDLKTENVMVTPEGMIKILDFGLAKALWRGADVSLSIEGSILGTGRSMSPEQALGDEISHRSDLFSLGTLIYETVTGLPPFTGTSIFRILAQICSDPHPPASEINPAVPMELERLIDRLLEKDPAKRPESATEVLEILDTLLPTGQIGTGGAPALKRQEGGLGARRPANTPPWQTPETTEATSHPVGEDTLWMPPPQSGRRTESTSGLHIRTLLRITIKESERLVELGTHRAQVVASRHGRLVRDLLAKSGGLEIDKLDDGFLLLFELPSEAVSYALGYLHRLADFSAEERVEIAAGIGIHLGELHMTENLPSDVSRGAKLLEVAGPAKNLVNHTAALANEGQVLMTQMAYELARRAMVDDDELDLEWVAHGRYRIRNVDEEQAIFEVGSPGKVSTLPPVDNPDVTRLSSRGEDTSKHTHTPRWHSLGMPLALLAVLAFGLLAIRFLPSNTTDSGSDKQRPTMAVLGFKNLSDRAEVEWLSTALAELFAAELAAGGDLRLVAGENVARMKLELELPAAETLASDTLKNIRRHLGTDHVLVGSYLALDRERDSLRLQLRLQPTRGGETIFVNATGSEAELFELVSEAALGLRLRLGLKEISSQQEAAVKATLSASPEAARLYSEGLDKLRAYDARGARDLLLQAVEIEPEFALAHATLSEAWRALGFDRKALTSARNAFEQADSLPQEQLLSIEGRFYKAASRWQEAVEIFQRLRDDFPDDIDHGLRLAEVQTLAGRGREALATVDRLLELPAPAVEDPRIDLARAQVAASLSDYQGVVEAASTAEKKGRALKARVLVAEALLTKGRALQRLGSNSAAVEALEEARAVFDTVGDRGKVAQALTSIAVLSKLEGNLTGAGGLYRKALAIHRETGNRKQMSRLLNNLAIVIMERGDLATASSMLEEAVEIEHEDGRLADKAGYQEALAQLRLAQGNLAAARDLAEKALPIFQEADSRGPQAWVHYALGRILFAAGEMTNARKELEAARRICAEIGNRHLAGRVRSAEGEVLLAAGELDAADQALEEALAIRSELGEKGMMARTQLVRGKWLIATQRYPEAEELMRKATRELSRQSRSDDQITATALFARALLAQEKLDRAREIQGRARDQAKESQNPAIRMAVAITNARLLAAGGDSATALSELKTVLAEAEGLGLLELVLETRLALGEIEISTADSATGRSRLRSLADDAASAGFGLIAETASAGAA